MKIIQKSIDEFILRDSIDSGTNRPVYKNPELTFHISILAKWFAKSDIVVSIRDPRDTICSFIDIREKHKKIIYQVNFQISEEISIHYVIIIFCIIINF